VFKVRELGAVTGVGGLLAAALVVASPPVEAMQPLPADQAGSIVQTGEADTQTLPGGPYSAVSQQMDANVFAVKASDGTLQRVVSNDNSAYDIPSGVAGEKVLSLGSLSDQSGGGNAFGVVTDDGFPHIWGDLPSNGFAAVVNGLNSSAALGGDGAPAKATQIAITGNGTEVGILLDDGRVGVVAQAGSVGNNYVYRVLNSTTLPGKVMQIEGFSGASRLVLRLENGGALIWNDDDHSDQGTVTAPAFPEMSGSGAGPADKLVDIEAGQSNAIGVSAAGKVYVMNADGTPGDVDRVDGQGNFNPQIDTSSVQGKPVQAATLQGDSITESVYMVRTDANKLYAYGDGLADLFGVTSSYQQEADSLDLSGKQITSLTGGAAYFQVILADAVDPLAVSTSSLPDATVGTAYDQTLAATGGTSPYTWSVTDGTLPAGLSLDGSTGKITGTPSGTPGKSSFTVTATDSQGTPATASADLSITVAAAPVTTVASTTKLSISPASAAIGAARTVTATVAKSGGVPTGNVTFKSGTTTKTVALSNGKAAWKLPRLSVGTHPVSASYAGDATTDPSTATAVNVKVVKAASKVAVAAKKSGSKVNLTITVKTVAGVSPAGKVTITLKGKTKRTIRVTVNAKGKATVAVKKLKHGTYTAVVAYAGNGSVNASKATKKFKA